MSRPSANQPDPLSDLYEEDRYKGFFDWASQFKNDVSTTSLDKIEQELQRADPDVVRGDAIAFCKKLEAIGGGTFKVGRHGKKSRMEWRWTLRSIGAVASGRSDEVEVREAEEEEEELLRIEVPLRSSSVRAVLELPSSLSEQDVKKLIGIIKQYGPPDRA